MLAGNNPLRPLFDESSKIALSLGNLSVTWYALIILSGALIGAILAYYLYLKKLGVNSDTVSEGLAFGLLFGILGARLYYVLFSGQQYDGLLDIINPSNGGLAIHGAVIAVAIYVPVYCKIRHIALLPVLEIVFPTLMFCQAIGRWGNFVNQEAFGSLIKFPGFVDVNTALTDANLLAQREFLSKLLIPNFIIDRMYIPYSSASGWTVAGYYHPTFLYESLLNLLGLCIYAVLRKKWKKVLIGDSVCFYLIWYGAVRIFIESLRTDPLMLGNTGIKVAQLISCLFIVGGIALIVLRRVFKFKLTPCCDVLYNSSATIMLDKIDASKKNKVLVFDCDGTVLDTFELIEHIVFETFKEVNPDYPLTIEEAHSFFGPYINDTFTQYAKNEEELNLYINTYNKYASILTEKYIKAYPGIKEALTELKKKGFIIVVASNKISLEVNRGLKICKLNHLVDYVIGAEQMKTPKPNADCLNQVMAKYNVKKVLMIGDTENDILCGKNAKCYTCGVTWCVSTSNDFKLWKADEIVSNPLELIKLGEKYEDRL